MTRRPHTSLTTAGRIRTSTSVSVVLALGFGVVAISVVALTVAGKGGDNIDDNAKVEQQYVSQTLGAAYDQLKSMLWAYHNISQISSDEIVVVVRGTDWDDAGRWRAMHQHTWNAFLVDLNDVWTEAFVGVARANQALRPLRARPQQFARAKARVAEARFLRAFFYFQLLDLFGGVPIVTEADTVFAPARSTRMELFDFLESELQEARTDLPLSWDPANYGRATRGAADALLARMYLNAEILAGTPTSSGIVRAAPRWQDAATAASRIIDSGVYQLEDNWFSNFGVNNHLSDEIIFSIILNAAGGQGLTFNMRVLHYNQLPQTPWNGFSTLAEVFNSFDSDDNRGRVFLEGQQYTLPNEGCAGRECFSDTDSQPLTDRLGNPLIFTLEYFNPQRDRVTDPVGVDESSGARVLKWEIDPDRQGADAGNDYAVFRLGEIYLIRAEAYLNLEQEAAALADVNVVRARSFEPDEPLTSLDSEAILMERRFELINEATRRQDLIRHGRFSTGAWEFKSSTDPWRDVFPVPQTQIDANPNLVQNPGY